MAKEDDILQLAAVMMSEDGCCQMYNQDGRCCMSDNAQRVLDAVIPRLLTEIALSGMRAGVYTGVLAHWARRNGIEWKRPDVDEIATQQ
jgi:hypothetical protein